MATNPKFSVTDVAAICQRLSRYAQDDPGLVKLRRAPRSPLAARIVSDYEIDSERVKKAFAIASAEVLGDRTVRTTASKASMFEELAADPADLVGCFAYIFYKQQQLEYRKSFGDCGPTAADLAFSRALATLPTSIAGYRLLGKALACAYLNASLDQLFELQTEAEP